MKKILLVCTLALAIMPSIAFSAAEGRSYNLCSTSSNCYIYSNHGIYNRFTTIGSYITSTLTQKDNSAGGSSTAQVTYGGGGQELGSTISYYTGNLSYNGDSIYTYNYQGEQGVTYAATGISSVSSSNKFLANVK